MKELLFRLSDITYIQVINQVFLGPQMYKYVLEAFSSVVKRA